MLLFSFLGRLFDFVLGPFLRASSLVPYTDRLRELIAADVDDLRRYGAYYASTAYGQLAGQTVVGVLSGGNLDLRELGAILAAGDPAGAGQQA